MKKNFKRSSLIAVSCLALACVSVGGVLASAQEEAQDPVFSMENEGAFYMVEGAAVKLFKGELNGIDGNAMRFVFEMSKAQYDSMIKNEAYIDGVSVNAYVIAEDMIDEGLTTAQEIAQDENVVETLIPANKWLLGKSEVYGSTTEVYHACAYVYNVPEEFYDDNVSAFAIATIGDETLTTTVQTRSMSYVADKALESGEYENDRETLEGYLTDKYVWIKMVNGKKTVTDFTVDYYVEKQTTEVNYTKFQRIISKSFDRENSIIVTENEAPANAEKGNYAKLLASTTWEPATGLIQLPPTMDLEELQAFADLGYVLKLKLYLDNATATSTPKDTNRTLRTLQYNESTGEFVSVASANNTNTTTITPNTWTEVEVPIKDYIQLMTNLEADGTLLNQTINTKCILGISMQMGETIYVSEMYLEENLATVANVKAPKGYKLNITEYVTATGEESYEYYTLTNGTLTELNSNILTVNEASEIVIVKVLNGERTFVGKVSVSVESADEWLASINTDKTVTDFTGDVYYDAKSGNTVTYFARENGKVFNNKVSIETTAPNAETGSYAKFSSASWEATASLMLYNTMSLETLTSFADMGYTMKVKIYIDNTASTAANASKARNVRTVQRNAEGVLVGVSNASNTTKISVTPNTWTEVEVSIYDYIYLVETVGRPYTQRTATQAMIGIYVYAKDTIYMSEMYLEAPKGDEEVTANAGDTLTLANYKPAEEASYEYYKFENGVYTAIEETTVTVGANDFQIAVVKVAIVDGNVERTFVKRVDVAVSAQATA